MMLDPDSCYTALKTHDARFDGRFFIGVASTGIYCRPVCTVRTPKRENCHFFPSAAAAEQAGYRPCLRCRPELAPGNARVDAVGRLAQTAAGLLEDHLLNEASVGELAKSLGITDRHLRRVFHNEFGVSPIEFAQTQRLLLAKRLLTDTDLAITEVAFASGFSSLRRFNALLKGRYRLSPSALRKSCQQGASGDLLQFELAYRPPFAWESLLSFLTKRAIGGVEEVTQSAYRRTVIVSTHQGWIEVTRIPGKSTLQVTLSASLAKAIPSVLARVKRLFDLACNPTEVAQHLGTLAATDPGLRVPGAFDGFEVAVRTILGQQVTVAAATTLAGRFTARFGQPIATPFPALTHGFPPATTVAAASAEDIAALGIVRLRARAIVAVAKALVDGALVLEPGVDVAEAIKGLCALPGIGEWTAQYIAMRALAWPDAFLHTDLGVRKALGRVTPKQALETAAPWQPWRAYAVMHLWHSLEKPA